MIWFCCSLYFCYFSFSFDCYQSWLVKLCHLCTIIFYIIVDWTKIYLALGFSYIKFLSVFQRIIDNHCLQMLSYIRDWLIDLEDQKLKFISWYTVASVRIFSLFKCNLGTCYSQYRGDEPLGFILRLFKFIWHNN